MEHLGLRAALGLPYGRLLGVKHAGLVAEVGGVPGLLRCGHSVKSGLPGRRCGPTGCSCGRAPGSGSCATCARWRRQRPLHSAVTGSESAAAHQPLPMALGSGAPPVCLAASLSCFMPARTPRAGGGPMTAAAAVGHRQLCRSARQPRSTNESAVWTSEPEQSCASGQPGAQLTGWAGQHNQRAGWDFLCFSEEAPGPALGETGCQQVTAQCPPGLR